MSLIAVGAGLTALAVPLIFIFLMFWIWATVSSARARYVALGFCMGAAIIGAVSQIRHAAAHERKLIAFESACRRETLPIIRGKLFGIDRVLRNYDFPDSRATRLADNVAFSPNLADNLLLSGFAPMVAVGDKANGRQAETVTNERGEFVRRLSDAKFRLAYSWRADELTPEGFEKFTMIVTDLQTGSILAEQPVLVTLDVGVKAFPSLWFLPTRAYSDRDRSCPGAVDLVALLRQVAPPAERMVQTP